jgi:hypothetical protein
VVRVNRRRVPNREGQQGELVTYNILLTCPVGDHEVGRIIAEYDRVLFRPTLTRESLSRSGGCFGCGVEQVRGGRRGGALVGRQRVRGGGSTTGRLAVSRSEWPPGELD